jgi:glycosyltransferase involved in cell wall biosynthesis
MTVTLLVPTLNELEGMKIIMPRVKREWVDEIVVIDGGSWDGTIEYAESQGFRVLHQKSRGITRAYQEALPHLKGEVIIAFSPDNNSVPELIPQLVDKMKEGYDMVIASRYLPGAQSEDDDLITTFGNWMFTQIINILFRASYTDSLVMMRAWRADLERELPVHYPRAGMETFLSIRCAKRNLKVAEIPGDEPARIGSPRKMNPILNGLDVLRLILSEFFRRD